MRDSAEALAGSPLPRGISRRAAITYLDRISQRIEELSSRRSALWTTAPDPACRDEIHDIGRRIDRLWEAYRWLRGAALNGSHNQIVSRARLESELERSLKRQLERMALDEAAAGRR